MRFTPSWQTGQTGWYPIKSKMGRCLYCKGELSKLHGLNRDGNGGIAKDHDNDTMVMAFFAFGAGPYCLHCAVKEAWRNKDFFQQSGNSEYHSSRYDLGASYRLKFPSIQDELKKL